MIEIRPFRQLDAEPFIALLQELQAWEASLYERMKPASAMGPWYIELLQQQCLKEAGTILIACDSDRPVGYATIFTNVVEDGSGDELAYSYAHVGDLVVTETARRQGVARRLLEECEMRARAAGCDELRIGVLARNHRAHEVYRAYGFEDHHISMRKRLIT